MVEVECITKKWGSSIGVILPKDIIEKEHIEVNEKIFIDIKKKHKANEFFGLLPNWKRSTEEIKMEMKRGWK